MHTSKRDTYRWWRLWRSWNSSAGGGGYLYCHTRAANNTHNYILLHSHSYRR